MVLCPVQGIPLGRWTTGLNLQPSIPLLGLLANQIWGGAFHKELFRSDDRKAGWIFGSVAGTGLYPLALGLGNFDPYSLGWSFTVLFPVVALTTVILIWKRNRFGLLLLLSILAYDLRLLESPNFWDYLVDPLFWLISPALLMKSGLKIIRRSTVGHPGEKACLPADAR